MKDSFDDFGLTVGRPIEEGEGDRYLEPSKQLRDNGRPLDNMGHEFIGFTVGDGFKFGCGFTLAAAIGVLIALILATVFMIIGVLFGFKLPFFG
ncbi:MAG: hypothetical protein ACOX87_14925 [Chloroflexota bacterium]